jgi:hypothetical protein
MEMRLFLTVPFLQTLRMPKARAPVAEPTLVRTPNSPAILSVIDPITGKHHVKCVLCHSDITLTITAHPRSLIDHRGYALCLQSRRSQGLPEPEPRLLHSASKEDECSAFVHAH